MAPAGTDAQAEQFKFLITCIKHSTAGKIDFGQVATECEIVSKAAAAKRYERLMKAHGITNNGNGAGPSGPVTPAGKGKAKVKGKIPASQTPKKRKLDEAVEDDDEEGIDEPSKAEAPKAEKETKVEPTYSDGDA